MRPGKKDLEKDGKGLEGKGRGSRGQTQIFKRAEEHISKKAGSKDGCPSPLANQTALSLEREAPEKEGF